MGRYLDIANRVVAEHLRPAERTITPAAVSAGALDDRAHEVGHHEEYPYIATNPARQPILDLLIPLYHNDPMLADEMRRLWMAHIDAGRAVGRPVETIERDALRAVENELNRIKHEAWVRRTIQRDIERKATKAAEATKGTNQPTPPRREP